MKSQSGEQLPKISLSSGDSVLGTGEFNRSVDNKSINQSASKSICQLFSNWID